MHSDNLSIIYLFGIMDVVESDKKTGAPHMKIMHNNLCLTS